MARPGNGLKKRNDPFGTVLLNEAGEETKVLKHCPHCGMIDYRFSSQGIGHTHWQITRVGGITKYQCGKCRKYFCTLEVQVPLDIEPMELYKNINETLVNKDRSSKGA